MPQIDTPHLRALEMEVKTSSDFLAARALSEIESLPLKEGSKQEIKAMVEQGQYGAAMDLLLRKTGTRLQ